MKKITFLFITLMVAIFCACNNNDDDTLEHSKFIYSDDSIVISILGRPDLGITIFKNGECVYQNLWDVKISGDYPNYTYTYHAHGSSMNVHLQLTCSYSNPSSFIATVVYCNIVGQTFSPHYKGEAIILPNTMLFKADNKTLDANGDGLLDE